MSKYQENFMLKGGMLLTYTLGVQNRATQDIDFLIKEIQLDAVHIKASIEDIVARNNTSNVWFEVVGDGEEIREEDAYGGLRFHIVGHLSNIRLPFAVDIATGDPIYPPAKTDTYVTVLGDAIELTLYPLESVLSEKLQTVLARAENNSRSKDFYDIYTILTSKLENINIDSLKVAIALTFRYRHTEITKNDALNIINTIYSNLGVRERWGRYQKKNPYAKDVDFPSVIEEIKKLIELVM